MEQVTEKILKIDEFLQDRILVDKIDNNISKIEKKFIMSILTEVAFFKKMLNENESSSTLQLIDSNLEYDSYSFRNNDTKYILKITEDDEDGVLKKEFDNLTEIDELNISPKALHFETLDFGRKIDVLITSFEHGLCFKDLSRSDLLFNIRTLANTLSYLHESTVVNQLPETQEFKEEFFALTNYKENLPEDRYQGLENSQEFLSHLPVLDALKQSVNENLATLPKNQICLNHTNLFSSRIMYRDKMIKFINFQYGKKIDCLWDVAFTIYYLGLNNNPKNEKAFLEQYLKSHDKLDMTEVEFLEKVSIYKNAAFKLILIKLLCSYFYEAIIFGTDRPSKFVEIVTVYESIRDDLAKAKDAYLIQSGAIKTVDEIFNVYFK